MSQALREMLNAGLMERIVRSEMPVAIVYRLTPNGRDLAAIWR